MAVGGDSPCGLALEPARAEGRSVHAQDDLVPQDVGAAHQKHPMGAGGATSALDAPCLAEDA